MIDGLARVCILILIFARCGKIFRAEPIIVIKFFLKRGSLIALKGYESERVTVKERLVSY